VAREDDILQGINSGSGPPWESAGHLYIQTGPPSKVQDLHGCKPDPWDGFRTPLRGVWATHGRVSGFWDKEYPCLNQCQAVVRSRHVFGPYCIRSWSSLRRSPDAATWPGARDVSQRAEPDVRPLGRAASAFIVDKACRLSNPLAGDVLPRHLMSPVHSTGRRCAASAFNEPCPLRWQATTRPSRRQRACLFHWQTAHPYCHMYYTHHDSRVTEEAARHINTIWTTDIMALRDRPGVTGISSSFHFAPRPTCRGSVSLYVPPLSYKREGTQRYKAHSDSLTLSHSLRPNSDSHTHKFIQALKLTVSI
jgi:hypothetical protein